MKLLEHTKNDTSYKIRIWLDETKFDPQGNPYPEWVLERTWGLDPPTNQVEEKDAKGKTRRDGNGQPILKEVPAMDVNDYEASQLEEAIAQAREVLAKLTGGSEQVTAPKEL